MYYFNLYYCSEDTLFFNVFEIRSLGLHLLAQKYSKISNNVKYTDEPKHYNQS